MEGATRLSSRCCEVCSQCDLWANPWGVRPPLRKSLGSSVSQCQHGPGPVPSPCLGTRCMPDRNRTLQPGGPPSAWGTPVIPLMLLPVFLLLLLGCRTFRSQPVFTFSLLFPISLTFYVTFGRILSPLHSNSRGSTSAVAFSCLRGQYSYDHH